MVINKESSVSKFSDLEFYILILSAVHMERMFLYGTLKKGQPNHNKLLDYNNGQAEFIICARTVDKYPLVIASVDKYPFLLNVPGSGQQVYGEIYNVDQKMLKYLDEFEECPVLYQRTLIQLEILKGNKVSGRVEEAFVYITSTYDPDWLNKPTYESYDSNGDHGPQSNESKSADFSQNSEQAIGKTADSDWHWT